MFKLHTSSGSHLFSIMLELTFEALRFGPTVVLLLNLGGLTLFPSIVKMENYRTLASLIVTVSREQINSQQAFLLASTTSTPKTLDSGSIFPVSIVTGPDGLRYGVYENASTPLFSEILEASFTVRAPP